MKVRFQMEDGATIVIEDNSLTDVMARLKKVLKNIDLIIKMETL